MDAGLAGVLGALAGAAATTGAALATGRATRKQAEIAARAEHRRQRREPREAVYREFLAAASALSDHARPNGGAVIDEEFAQRAIELADAVHKSWLEVALLGPKGVVTPASDARVTAYELAESATILGGTHPFSSPLTQDSEQIKERFEKFLKEAQLFANIVNHFMAEAQRALDDDGTHRG